MLRTVPYYLSFLFFALGGSLEPVDPSIRPAADAPTPAHVLYDTIRTDLRAYAWPMMTSRAMTSSFGEFRTTHFHAGMDISTGDTIGLPVIAARGGYVSRVVVSPTGYGKMVYVRHPDGYTTTYAHLFGFPPWLDAAVRAEQQLQGCYPVELDLPPGQFPVTTGQIVAFAGESGSGSAHLHFEIRDENNNTINPLLTSGISITDNLTPLFRGVLFAPLTQGTSINGELQPLHIAVRETAPGQYITKGTPVLSGIGGFGVDVRDRSNLSRFQHGFHALRLFVDDAQVMGVCYDRVPLREGHQIRLVYVQDPSLRRRDRFHKLYIDTYHRLPIFPGYGPGSGIIQSAGMSPGMHSFRVECEDFNGNVSQLKGSFRTEGIGGAAPGRVLPAETYHIDPDRGGTIRTRTNAVTISYEQGAVFSPVDLSIHDLDEPDAKGVSIMPHGIPMDDGFTFQLRSPASTAHTGVYTRSGESWTFLSRGDRDSASVVSVRLRRFLGDVAMVEDSVPPSIYGVSVSGSDPKPRISFRFRDNLSGVEYKEVKVYIDGIMVIPEIDGEHRRAFAQHSSPLAKGSHRLTILVSDRMGNRAEVERSFHVR